MYFAGCNCICHNYVCCLKLFIKSTHKTINFIFYKNEKKYDGTEILLG